MILVLLEDNFERIHKASVTGMFCSFNFFSDAIVLMMIEEKD